MMRTTTTIIIIPHVFVVSITIIIVDGATMTPIIPTYIGTITPPAIGESVFI